MSADVRIGDYRLKWDGLQWTVSTVKTREKGDNAGKEYESDFSYYSKLSHAALETFERLAGGEGAHDAEGLLRATDNARRAILEAVADLERSTLRERAGNLGHQLAETA